MDDVFGIILRGTTGLFIMGVLFYIGLGITGQLTPMIISMNPNSSVGISNTTYLQKIEALGAGYDWSFYILIFGIFLFVAVKLLYDKEHTSTYGGSY